ncbi:MAG: carboxymuconolactone decarboxylase family protein [Limnohabitans sp.]|nr:carboxymuconolactone decarboxylase family protein [Limnohabitans sp.]
MADDGPSRFPLLSNDQMTTAQKGLANLIRSGPRAAVPGSAANNATLGSPFNVFLRSPELGDHLQNVGLYIRFKSVLGSRLSEFAILITARHWTAEYEWHAHHRLAMQAGLSPEVAAAVAEGRRPTNMKADEEAIYNFCQELHTNKRVSDASFKAVADLFGEQGVMDLIAVNGYYVTLTMVLNVDRTPVPGGAPPPLKALK